MSSDPFHAPRHAIRFPRRAGPYLIMLVLVVGACKRKPEAASSSDVQDRPDALVVYCSVDEGFATTGLVNKIISEAAAGRPRADVFWSGELFNTIMLGRKGLLEPYDSPAAVDIPARFRDSQHRWTATAARARVLAFDPQQTRPEDVPARWEDLAVPEVAKHTAVANPLFGTTRGHVAAMFALWGAERGRAFLQALRDGGVRITDGNSAAVRAVAAGRAKLAATDTDDVWVAQRSGVPLDSVYPDMGDGGTLLIPCSVAIVKGSDNLEAAGKLVDFLVSAEVERLLAKSDSRNIPVRDSLLAELEMTRPPQSKVDFDAVVDAMDEAVAAAREILIR
jgi:iron(III) transport system substrate-binding protein